VSFLSDLLPARAEASWSTAIIRAVDRVGRTSEAPTCGEVIRALDQGDAVDEQVARTLAVYARSGLTQLGFASPDASPPESRSLQVTYISLRDLPAPQPGVSRAEYSQAEKVAEQIVRLLALFAMRLLATERERLKVFAFDEGWRLLSDPAGRLLVAGLQRMGRSELAVPIIGTQLVTDAVGDREALDNLVGATFAFGMRSETEAARALALLGLDPEDDRLKRTLIDLRPGQCLLRDYAGRIEAVQIDLAASRLLQALSTTPRLDGATHEAAVA
jgi:AAA-like domain